MIKGALAGLLVALLISAAVWTNAVLKEDRAWWRKAPAVCSGLVVIALAVAGLGHVLGW
jgi:hypothetical protein